MLSDHALILICQFICSVSCLLHWNALIMNYGSDGSAIRIKIKWISVQKKIEIFYCLLQCSTMNEGLSFFFFLKMSFLWNLAAVRKLLSLEKTSLFRYVHRTLALLTLRTISFNGLWMKNFRLILALTVIEKKAYQNLESMTSVVLLIDIYLRRRFWQIPAELFLSHLVKERLSIRFNHLICSTIILIISLSKNNSLTNMR